MAAYYNEFDPYAAAWLRNLITAGHIPSGEVDERSIVDVQPDDLAGFTQCHFFAGIGGWPLAARLAGLDSDFPLWSGSCPCQPFSAAGKQKGTADERHLWPEFHRLIRERRPAVVFGEQVASKLGREWLAGIRLDLEDVGYAVGAADLCAAGVGAPHIRQRLFWVADATGARRDGPLAKPEGEARHETRLLVPGVGGATGRLGDAYTTGCGGLAQSDQRAPAGQQSPRRTDAQRSSFWDGADWLPCTDGKARRVESGTFPLAHGVPGRVGRLRAYGNAIVPQVAAEFIKAWLDCRP